MKNKLFKASLIFMSTLILGATTIPSGVVLANELDSTQIISQADNIVFDDDKLIINNKEISESEFNTLLENASTINFNDQNYSVNNIGMATGLLFFVPGVGSIAIAAGGAIIIGGAVVTTAWIVKAVKNFVNNEDNWTADQIISKKRKGSIRREFPGEYLNKKYKDIKKDADKGNAKAKKAKKLLNDGRFKK